MRSLLPHEIMVLKFMDDHGHPAYRLQLGKRERAHDGEHSFGERDVIRKEWEEIIQAAVDRYDDWASD